MGKRLVFGTVVFSVLVSACVTTLSLKPRNYEQIRLQDEANEYYSAIRDKNTEKVWNLSSPTVKRENRKEEYLTRLERFMGLMADFDYSDFSVVYIGKKLAVTQAMTQAKFANADFGGGLVSICERIVWVRYLEGWRFREPGMACTYMPDKKRIEFLTKNVPD